METNIYGFDWKNLPKVKLTEKNHLPDSPGIYFVAWSGRLQYIGIATKSLKSRWMSHHRYNQAYEESFNSAEIHYSRSEDSLLKEAERWLIKTLRPLLNQTRVPKKDSYSPLVKENADSTDKKVKLELYLPLATFKKLLIWSWLRGQSSGELCANIIAEEMEEGGQFTLDLNQHANKKPSSDIPKRQFFDEYGLSFAIEPNDKDKEQDGNY